MLQQELEDLRCILSAILGGNQKSPVHPLYREFACISIAVDSGRMDRARENAGLMDIRKNLHLLYEMTAIGIMDAKEMAK